MANIVAYGGFAEAAPDRVVDAAIELGYAEDGEAYSIYDLRDNPYALLSRARGQIAVFHSASVGEIIPEALGADVVATFGGPEEASIEELISSAFVKTAGHVGRSIMGPRRLAHLEILAQGTAQLIGHPVENWKILNKTPSTSTFKILRAVAEHNSGSTIGLFSMEDDEFFPPAKHHTGNAHTLAKRYGIDLVKIVPGRHDDLLVDPASVLPNTLQVLL